jgi:hypothetical protein
VFGLPGTDLGEGGPGGGLGIDRVGFALPAAGLAVRPVDLHHRHALMAQMTCQACAVDTSALDSHQDQCSERTQPGQQRCIAGLGRRKLRRSQDLAHGIDHGRGVGVLVGIDTTGDLDLMLCKGGHSRPVPLDPTRAARTSQAIRTRQRWGLWPGSYKVTRHVR